MQAKEYSFFCYGHENIEAKHSKTMEFIKDNNLSSRGDCIIGVKSNFECSEIKKIKGKVRITIEVQDLKYTFKAKINPYFNSNDEIVFRKSNFNSPRTLGWSIKKGASGIDREIINLMKNPLMKMKVTIQEKQKLIKK